MNQKLTELFAVILFAVVVLSMAAGCCTKNTGSSPDSSRPAKKRPALKDRHSNSSDKKRPIREIEKFQNEFNTGDPQLDENRRKRAEHLRHLELAHEMLLKSNYQGALREVERVQMNLRDEPYIEMQAWYLSAMIYHRSGKTSRRKRSMRKMLEAMEALQKDSRFKELYLDGMETQKLIQKAIEMEGYKNEE